MCINVLPRRPRPFKFGRIQWRFFMQIFQFFRGGALSSHQKVTSFCQESIINMINDPSYDPLRQQIHNQGYLLIQMKISQMEKSVF